MTISPQFALFEELRKSNVNLDEVASRRTECGEYSRAPGSSVVTFVSSGFSLDLTEFTVLPQGADFQE